MLNDFKLFEDTYNFILWLWPVVSRFPKSEKFVLGEKLKQTTISLMNNIIAFNNTDSDKKKFLFQASIDLEELRVFIRLSKDLKILDFKKYESSSKQLDEMGKLLGGLISKYK